MFSEAKYVYSALVRLRDIIFYAAQPGQRMDLQDEDYAHALKRVAPDFAPWVKVARLRRRADPGRHRPDRLFRGPGP